MQPILTMIGIRGNLRTQVKGVITAITGASLVSLFGINTWFSWLSTNLAVITLSGLFGLLTLIMGIEIVAKKEIL